LKQFIKPLVAVLCLVGTFFSIYNVKSDIGPLQKQAESVACPDGCAQLLGLQRMPTSQTFTFQVKVNQAETRTIECTRDFLLVGDYHCASAANP
jgi:hypothetical protein